MLNETNETNESVCITDIVCSSKVPGYVNKINKAMGNLTKHWLSISTLLNEAKIELTRKEFFCLKSELDLDASTINKLLKVGESKFVSKNMEAFKSVRSWVVLYQIALMTPLQQKQVLALAAKQKITLKDVHKIRNANEPKVQPVVGSPFIQLRLDTSNITDPSIIAVVERDVCDFIASLNGTNINLSMVSCHLQQQVENRLERETKMEVAMEVKERDSEIYKVVRAFVNKEMKSFPTKNQHREQLSKQEQFQKKWPVCTYQQLFASSESLAMAASMFEVEDQLSPLAQSYVSQCGS
jgi:hypothetical protein